MTIDAANDWMATGTLSLADVARYWSCSLAEAYQRLYGSPMSTPATLPAAERRTIRYRPRRPRR